MLASSFFSSVSYWPQIPATALPPCPPSLVSLFLPAATHTLGVLVLVLVMVLLLVLVLVLVLVLHRITTQGRAPSSLDLQPSTLKPTPSAPEPKP